MMLEKELKAAKEAAYESGKILMANYGRVSVRYKKDRSIVTDSDLASEKLIKEALKKEFPEYSFLAEESGLEDTGSEYEWVIDPLDGTTNYSIRNPFFNVSIALAKNDVPVLGVVYYPFQDELFHAVDGMGAYLNDQKIRVSAKASIRDAFVCFCHGHDPETVNKAIIAYSKIKPVTDRMRQIGASELELSYLGCGRVDAFFMLKQNPWDIASGTLIVREAGGIVSDIDGKSFNLKSKDAVASNGLVHKELLELLRI
ncbi:MAG: inositol monophosphatase family protein [Candidatus Altiarchaeia archaeon]